MRAALRLVPAIVVLCARPWGCTPTERAAPVKAEEAPAAPAAEQPAAPTSTELAPGEAPVLAAPQDAAPAGPPEDFGAIRPPLPLPAPAELIVHAIAGYEVVAIYALPDLASPRLGYLKIGARTMVTAKIEDRGTGCASGFHGLPAGGFACAGKGLIVDANRPPYMYLTPPPPRIDAPIPYDYGVVVRDGTPMWWRIPDAEEVTLAGQKYDALLKAQAEVEAATKPKPAAKPKEAPPDAEQPAEAPEPAPPETAGEPLPGVDDVEAPPPPAPLTPEEKAEIARREAAARKRAEARKKQEAEEERRLARKRAKLPLNSQTPFMEAGYVVSLAHKVKQQGASWWKTTRGGFVQASRVHGKETRDFHGGEVPADARHAFGFVMSESAAGSARNDKGALQWKRRLAHREFLAFTEEVEVGGRPYLVTSDGLYVRKADLRLAAPATRPAEVQPWERWIDVDLERQLLVAYAGDVPVYAALVSSGKRGSEDEFLTPKGRYRINGKHVSSSMDGNTASDGRYSIQDVPWAMFFHGNYALHGAFWHSKFGERRSHGCVNLGPTDARWLFFWTTPFVPDGWHGVNAHDGAPGSMVVVH